MARYVLDHRRPINLDAVCAVARGARVVLAPAARRFLDKRRAEIVSAVEQDPAPAYGFNRGFGKNVDQKVRPELVHTLQRNLIRSHACGVGSFAPREVVRAMMFMRARSLVAGHSGVRAAVVQQLVAFLNADITPCVPLYGSVGASGDLAPLSHVALALMGEGMVMGSGNGSPMPARRAMRRVRIQPLDLQMKEGLALINGVQYSTALGVLASESLERLLQTAIVSTALAAQVMLGSDAPFAADLQALRPHRGAVWVAAELRRLMRGSPLREAHRHYDVDGEVQDPYNLRCAPQILGTCADLIADARAALTVEINSVTDNPLLLDGSRGGKTRIVSGGHFHGMPVAVKLYNLMQAVGILSSLSHMRCVRYVDPARNKGLGSDLVWPALTSDIRSVSSGMMIPEYVAASLVNTIWGEMMPSHLFSLSTAAGQEDHVSMSAGLAVRLHMLLPRVAEVLGIELAYAAQAAAIRRVLDHIPSKLPLPEQAANATVKERKLFETALTRALRGSAFDARLDATMAFRMPRGKRRLSPICERIVRDIGRLFPAVKSDRVLSNQLQNLGHAVLAGRFAR